MEDFVTYEIAKKLKEKGYPMEEIPTGGIDNRNFPILYDLPKEHPNWQDCKAWWVPTISQVLKWLRKEKKMHMEIFLYDREYSYFVKSITQICEDDLFHKCLNDATTDEEYATYEQSALAGIEYVLDNLI